MTEQGDLLEDARHLIHQPPSRDAFLALCRLVEAAALRSPERAAQEVIPYLSGHLAAWPEPLRAAPLLWINRFLLGALPVEALSLISGLSLTAALTTHYYGSERYKKLIAWLRALPPTTPPLRGLSIALGEQSLAALKAAAANEPDARFHHLPPPERRLDEYYFYDEDDLLPALGASPLTQRLQVLEVRWDPPARDFDWDYQGILDGRGLTLASLARALPVDHLEALDLAGQCASPRAPLGLELPAHAFPALKRLDLSDGHPLGDEAARLLVKACPALEHLSLRSGPVVHLLSGYTFDDFDPEDGRDSIYGRLREHWRISSDDCLRRMRLTTPGYQALASLPALRTLELDPRHADATFPSRVRVYAADRHSSKRYKGAGIWASYFKP